MEVIWYTAMSMDGRIAGPGGDLSFLSTVAGGADDDWGFETFVSRVDAVLVGASTMRWLLDGGHGWPHGDLPTWLMTHDAALTERIGTTAAPLQVRSGAVQPVLGEMERDGRNIVWLCGGGDLAGQVLAAGGIDIVVVTIAPTVLGEGPALFDAAGLPANRFELTEHRPSGTALRAVWRRR